MARRKYLKISPERKQELKHIVGDIRKNTDRLVKTIEATAKEWRKTTAEEVKKDLERQHQAMMRELEKYRKMGAKLFQSKIFGRRS